MIDMEKVNLGEFIHKRRKSLGLSQKDIPLCARIMTVADVFDAVSEKRCYRDAMPLDKCFEIIKNGSGQDFDPVVAEVFLDIRKKVEAIYNEINHET